MFELLEQRRLLSAAIDDFGSLIITGSTKADVIEVSMSGENIVVKIAPEGFEQSFDASLVNVIGVIGDAGNDRITFSADVTKTSIIDGGAGNDTIVAGSGNDNIRGDLGNDLIDGGLGADTISGDQGIDTVTYATRTNNLDIRVGTGLSGEAGEGDFLDWSVERVFGGEGNDRISFRGASVPVVIYGNGGNDTLIGGESADRLVGGNGDDDIRGYGGDDFLIGSSGKDVFNGGDGVDTVSYYNSSKAVYVELTGRSVSGMTKEKDNLKPDVENVEGSRFDDHLVGDDKANFLRGLDGNDTLVGGAGTDLLWGDAGNDSIFAADGEQDEIFGGPGFNTLDLDDLLDNVTDPS